MTTLDRLHGRPDPARPGNDDAGLAPGAENSQQATNAADDAVIVGENQANKPGEFPNDKRGTPILDAAALEVLKAWRYFSTVPGDVPAIVAALLVIAWAIKGRLS